MRQLEFGSIVDFATGDVVALASSDNAILLAFDALADALLADGTCQAKPGHYPADKFGVRFIA